MSKAVEFQKYYKSWREIPDDVDFRTNWSWGTLERGRYFVSFTDEHCNETTYELPRWLSELLEKQLRRGGDDARRAIRSALQWEDV